ncbi:MAG TPA: hypothetical protein VLQ80_29230 [Candidatus Saccharimonadia bacterium]|nr:hypothetical protein [Candidatus Saccharimonadia bacterium]
MALKFPWSRKDVHDDDPYWDFFIKTPPADLTNTVTELIRNAPAGNIFPTPADIHTPEITAQHVKDLARYFGAELVGIARLETNSTTNPDGYPFAVLCAVRAEYDPRVSPGIGGQVPVQNGLFITFVLSAWIRELSFRASVEPHLVAETLAAQAGLGTLNAEGRLVTPQFGAKVYVADAICTDLPLAADG